MTSFQHSLHINDIDFSSRHFDLEQMRRDKKVVYIFSLDQMLSKIICNPAYFANIVNSNQMLVLLGEPSNPVPVRREQNATRYEAVSAWRIWQAKSQIESFYFEIPKSVFGYEVTSPRTAQYKHFLNSYY